MLKLNQKMKEVLLQSVLTCRVTHRRNHNNRGTLRGLSLAPRLTQPVNRSFRLARVWVASEIVRTTPTSSSAHSMNSGSGKTDLRGAILRFGWSRAIHKWPGAVLLGLIVAVTTAGPVRAWDYDAHRLICQLALGCLPPDFPAFVRTPAAQERIAFLGGEPDRWRNVPDLALRHFNSPDHYIDTELLELCGFGADTLPMFRYDFVVQLDRARAVHPDKFPPVNEAKNADRTQQLAGFLPWAITEQFGKVKSGFAYLKAYQEAGTADEVSNAQQNIIYAMGVLAHYVGDATQPLHTTIHYNGWTGPNPRGYTTNTTFHRWIDGEYFLKIGLPEVAQLQPKLRPARLVIGQAKNGAPDAVFRQVVKFVLDQHKQVEPLYELEKAGKLTGEQPNGLEGKAFLDGQLVVAAQMLADLWYTAYVTAPVDTYLRTQLLKRKPKTESAVPSAK